MKIFVLFKKWDRKINMENNLLILYRYNLPFR